MKENSYTVLVAEDDTDIIRLLRLYLENEGYEVLSAEDGLAAYRLLQSKHVDLCIFDIMMPKLDGYELIRKVRTGYNLPILVISARNRDSDRILGLNLGADDYISKPFNPLEVVARVNSALRRFYHLNEGILKDGQNLKVGELELDPSAMRFWKAGRELELTPTELKIMNLLMKSPGNVFTKVQICEYINGEYFENDENTIMVHISNLREKIEDDSKNPAYLKTVRGLGYKIDDGSTRL